MPSNCSNYSDLSKTMTEVSFSYAYKRKKEKNIYISESAGLI